MDQMARVAVDTYRTPQPVIEEFTLEDRSINSYVWYSGENLPWPEIVGGFIRRCRVTPILPFRIWERINDVPTDMRKAVRRDLMDREHQEAQYEIKPQDILESIKSQYWGLGLRELTALKGMDPQQVETLNIDAIFCPWDEIPKPYSQIEEHIRLTLGGGHLTPIQRAVGEEMLTSIKASREYDDIFVDRTESQKEPVYSNPVFRALSRLGRRRRDHALNDIAAVDLATKKAAAQASNDNSALVTEMAEQNRLKREELELRREELELNRQMMAKTMAEKKPGRPPKQANA